MTENTHSPEEQRYFPTGFERWDQEALSVVRWVAGSTKGIDVGCGRRSLHPEVYRVDANVAVDPDLVADARSLVGVLTDEYDWYWSSHNIEHCDNTAAVLKEAARVVRPGGYVVLIIPNKQHTAGLDPTHVHEWEPAEFINAWAEVPGLRLVDFGVASPEWSFRVVYQVLGEEVAEPEEPVSTIISRGLAEIKGRDWGLQPIRVTTMSDHVRLTTGFAQVTKQINNGFHRAGFDLSHLGIWEGQATMPGEFPYYVEAVCPHCDTFGTRKLAEFVRRRAPEVFFSLADPGTQYNRLAALVPTFAMPTQLRVSGVKPPCPILLYMPIEGVPIAEDYLAVIRFVQETGGRVVVYAQCQADAVEAQSGLKVDWAYHGSNHAPFRRYPEGDRMKLRQQVGFESPRRFVVMNVARNKRTNRHPEYIKAAAMLQEMGHTDVLFYLHCDPEDRYGIEAMQGWNLNAIAAQYGVWGHTGADAYKNMVVFPPRKIDQIHGITYNRRPGEYVQGQRGQAFESLSFIDRMNVSDIYMDASSVQGFGLPAVEAMRCGLPLFVTDDGFTRREVLGDVPYWLRPYATDYWQTGATLHLVSAEEIVKAILWAKSHPDELETMRQMSVAHAQTLTWQPLQEMLIGHVEALAGKGG